MSDDDMFCDMRVERDAAIARVRELEQELLRSRGTERDALVDYRAAIARADQAERERDELHNALVTHDRLADEVSANLRAAVDLGNKQLAEVTAQAAAMREALEAARRRVDDIGPAVRDHACESCIGYRTEMTRVGWRCWYHRDIGEAGRALLAELNEARRDLTEAVEGVAHHNAEAGHERGRANRAEAEAKSLHEVLEAYGAWKSQEGRAAGSDRWQDAAEARMKRETFVRLYDAALAACRKDVRTTVRTSTDDTSGTDGE